MKKIAVEKILQEENKVQGDQAINLVIMKEIAMDMPMLMAMVLNST